MRNLWRLGCAALLLLGLALSNARAEDTFRLVAENDWFPYSAERHGAPEGLAVDLVRAAFEAAGSKVELVSQPYARCLSEVEAGRQLGCFDTIREPSTEARFLFHE
jgi:polar amino acid transport system substrate-binding protein